jgi:hypothetical protein
MKAKRSDRSTTVIIAYAIAAMIAPAKLEAQRLADDESSCPVTQPPTPRFVPASRFPTAPYSSDFYFGSEKLWVRLPNRPWRGVDAPNGGRRVKFPWFADDLGLEESRSPDLSITGRRLNASAPPLNVEGPHLAWTTYYALTSALIFPSTGCWEISAKRKDTQIKFVMWVAQ